MPSLIFADTAGSRALALLIGAENARLKAECFRIRYKENRAETAQTADQVVFFDRGKIRKDHLPSVTFQGQKSIFCEDAVYRMTSYDAGSVAIVLPDSIQAGGADIYDPRLLGITGAMHIDKTIKMCFLYAERDKNKFSVSATKINGKSVNVVEYQDNERNGHAHWKIFINEPEFHVLRKEVVTTRGSTFIDNDYSNPQFLPFPTKVHIFRTETKDGKKEVVFDRHITVTEVEFSESFPPETFTLENLQLPLNADVNDYRINRRLGYWDGEKLVDNPVNMSAAEHREIMKQMEEGTSNVSIFGIICTSIGIAVILVVIVLLFLQKRTQTIQK